MSVLLCVLRAAIGALAMLAAPLALVSVTPAMAAGEAGRWHAIGAAQLAPRYPAVTAWTGSRLLEWGGYDRDTFYTDGALYDPGTDTWRAMAASPLPPGYIAVAAWTGRELVVWGVHECRDSPNQCGSGSFDDQGARYDPRTDEWRWMTGNPALAPAGCTFFQSGQGIWTGRRLLVFGDQQCGSSQAAVGATYDPTGDTWSPIALAPIGPRIFAAAAWTGSRMMVWGGLDASSAAAFADGASYDPARDRWDVLPAGPLQGRWATSSAWAGDRMVVVDGRPGSAGAFSDGAAYDPVGRAWRRIAPVPLTARSWPNVVAVGPNVFVWAGFADLSSPVPDAPLADGALYDVRADRWLALPPLPVGAVSDAVWAGDRVLAWGSTQHSRGAAWFPPSGLLAGLPFSSLAAESGAAALLVLVLGVALLTFRGRRRPVAAAQPKVVAAPAPAAADPRPARFCGLCGRALVEGDRFCRGCGATAERS
jgi:N-acetylneuraminic acid mutarotase